MPIRILITDDALFMRVILRDILTSNGYEVVGEASSGAESVKLFDDLRPDLVMMDASMPEMDGIAASRCIRDHHPNANILMCTSRGQKDKVIESIQSGTTDFVLKPFESQRVVAAVERLLAA